MLEMIFANGDLVEFPEYYDIPSPNQMQNTNQKNDKNKYQVAINIDEHDWGYYVDLDNITPPNKNLNPRLNLPKKNYTTNKSVNYLPPIEEEIFYTNTKDYTADDTSTTTSSVISSVTFCATIAFYYFYRNIRNN